MAALGGAYAAMSDDATGVFYNGAAMARSKKRSVELGYARLFSGLDGVSFSVGHIAFVQPLKKGVVGMGWGGFGAGFYREDTALAGYAYDISEVFDGYQGMISVGVSARYLTRRFVIDDRTISDPVFKDGNRTHDAAFDLHWFSVPEPNLFPGLSLGLSVRSVNQPDVGFKDSERLPREVAGGLLYQWRKLSIPVDIVCRGGELKPRFGLERTFWIDDAMAARVGTDLSQLGSGFGYTHELSKKLSLKIDYAFLWPLKLKKTTGSHRMTLGVKF